VISSRWRHTIFDFARTLPSRAAGIARPLIYVAAGLLTTEQLATFSGRRWSDFGADRTHVLSGLEPWEADFYARFLRVGDRVLVVGCGSGREIIALRRQGYRADGVDPATAAVGRARAMLAELGVDAEVYVGSMESAPPTGRWDACVFSWRCYSYIPECARRVTALRAARERVGAEGQILVSYVRRNAPPRRLPRMLAALIARLSGSARRPEATDVIALESGGLHFEHQFLAGELEAEAREAGLRILDRDDGEEATAVLVAEG
jgi:SAM-dependent methyltransferase